MDINDIVLLCCSIYNTDIVLIAVGITAVVCLAVSIFAIQTKVIVNLHNSCYLKLYKFDFV